MGLSKVVNFLRDHAGALSLFSCLFSSHLVLFCFCFVAGLKDDDLYRELWKLCAGPLVDVPRTGDRVFYFPQGHMEQVCIWFFFSLFLFFFFVAVFKGCIGVAFGVSGEDLGWVCSSASWPSLIAIGPFW